MFKLSISTSMKVEVEISKEALLPWKTALFRLKASQLSQKKDYPTFKSCLRNVFWNPF
jgi:hypothetical protein